MEHLIPKQCNSTSSNTTSSWPSTPSRRTPHNPARYPFHSISTSQFQNLIHPLHDTNRHRHQFPYALKALDHLLATQWDSPAFTPYRDAFPPEYTTSPDAFRAHVHDLVIRDVKIAYLKNLQGYLWVRGYESGELRCPLFPDVYPALDHWHEKGIPIVIYSSGSVAAQKLLFQYTSCQPDEDLRGLISGYFDTLNAGMKTQKESYVTIAQTREQDVGEWLFLSDRVEEVEAAKNAGMQSYVVVREGNVALSEEDRAKHVVVMNFDQIKINGW